MNSVNLIGRLTRDPEIKNLQSGSMTARFSLAVDGNRKDEKGSRRADFIPCVMWNKNAETARSYLRKGMMIGISGELRSGKYEDKNGNMRYTLEVWVSRFNFCGSKSSKEAEPLPEEVSGYGVAADYEDVPFNQEGVE